MTKEAADSNNRHLHGDALLTELRDGWAPLPQSTVLSMVISGLKIRLTRSLVTMSAIVLAIAFLSYTSMSNALSASLVGAMDTLSAKEPMDEAELRNSLAVLAGVNPFETQTLDRRRTLGKAWGLTEAQADIDAVSKMGPELRNARLDDQAAQTAATRIAGDARATATDRAAARARAVQTRAALTQLETREAGHRETISLAEWLDNPRAEPSPELEAVLNRRLDRIRLGLLPQSGGLSRLRSGQFAQLEVLMGDVVIASRNTDQAGAVDEAVAMIRQGIERERENTAASEIRVALTSSGTSIEAIRAGDTMGTWLIVMALMTCAVGIANAMLMSVTERFREIATMKCLGAQDWLVIKMFLMESGIQGFIGAMVGIPVGLAVAVFAALALFGQYGLTYFPWGQIAIAVFWSLVAGLVLAVVGAVYPAILAARMRPVEALRVEE